MSNSKSSEYTKLKKILTKKNFVILAVGIAVGIAISIIANSISGVHTNEISKTITDWMTAVGTVGAVIVSLWFSLSSLQKTRLSEQSQYLYNAFRLLNDNAHRNARRRCINLFAYKDEPSKVVKLLEKMGASPKDDNQARTIYLERLLEAGQEFVNQILLRSWYWVL